MSASRREQFECPYCGNMVWLPADAPPGTECPVCGQPLGVWIPSEADMARIDEKYEKRKQAFETAPTISLQGVEPPAEVLALIPASVAREQTIFPISRSEHSIRLAVPAFVEFEALDKVRFILNCDVELAIADEMEIRFAIEQFYGA